MVGSSDRAARRRAWIALVVWIGVIWTATSIPGRMLPEGPPGIDRLVHFALYVPLGFLLVLALTPSGGSCGWSLLLLLLAVGFGAVVAALDEWHQQYILNRTASIADWHWDLRGMIVGSVAALLATECRKRRTDVRDPRYYR